METVEQNSIMVSLPLDMDKLKVKNIGKLKILGVLLGDHKAIFILPETEMEKENVESKWLPHSLLYDLIRKLSLKVINYLSLILS